MLFEGRKFLKKIDGAAVLMQTLLGLAIMVAMTPVILSQIKKYNESINREEVISQMSLLQKAVTSYISFDRTSVPMGCVVRNANGIRTILKDYGGEKIVSPNKFGQSYNFITCKRQVGSVDDPQYAIDAAVFAFGDVDDLTLNGIGEYLFDQGVVLSNNDHAELTNYNAKLSATLKSEIVKQIGTKGALVMFVSDGFMVSDYLYINKGPGGSNAVNTMLANIDMNNHSLVNVYNAKGTVLNIIKDLKVAGLAGKNLSIADSVLGGVFSIENTAPFATGDVIQIITDNININSLQVENAEFSKISLDPGDLKTENLETDTLTVEGNVNVVADGENWQFGASNVEADSLMSNGTKTNVFKNITLKDDETSSEKQESYIYYGKVNESGAFDNAASGILNLSGMSEVTDICWDGGVGGVVGGPSCLSDQVRSVYNRILLEWRHYDCVATKGIWYNNSCKY